jgi:uncharacterized protein YraI
VQCNAVTAVGSPFTTTVTVTHNATNVPNPATYTVNCTVNPAPPTLDFTPPTLPNGTTGSPYDQVLTANGGTVPYTFSSSGVLPPGLSFSQTGAQYRLSGTPTVAGTYTFSVTLTDSSTPQQTRSRSYTISITGGTTLQPGYGSVPPPSSVINVVTNPNVPIDARITVSETGNAALSVASVAVSNPTVFSLVTGGAFVIPDGGPSVDIFVRCLSAAEGSYVTAVVVTHNAAGSPAAYTIACTVTTNALPTSTPFGTPAITGTVPPTAVPATATPAAPTDGTVSPEVKGLAVRTGPYLGATLIAVARPGSSYPILARSNDEGGPYTWYLITIGNRTGWVSGRYLQFKGDPNLLPVYGSIFDQIDDAGDVGVTTQIIAITDIRRRPSGRAAIIGQVPPEAVVSVIGRTVENGGNYWLHIRYNGITGWIVAYVKNTRGNGANVPIR